MANDALNMLCALVALVLPLGMACALLTRGGKPKKRMKGAGTAAMKSRPEETLESRYL